MVVWFPTGNTAVVRISFSALQLVSSPLFHAFISSLEVIVAPTVYLPWNMKVLCGYEVVILPSFLLEMVTRRQWLALIVALGLPLWSMVWPLFLPLSTVGWPFAVGFIGVGGVRWGMSKATWIYQPGLLAENESGFMIDERLFLLLCSVAPKCRCGSHQADWAVTCWRHWTSTLEKDWLQKMLLPLNSLFCKFV